MKGSQMFKHMDAQRITLSRIMLLEGREFGETLEEIFIKRNPCLTGNTIKISSKNKEFDKGVDDITLNVAFLDKENVKELIEAFLSDRLIDAFESKKMLQASEFGTWRIVGITLLTSLYNFSIDEILKFESVVGWFNKYQKQFLNIWQATEKKWNRETSHKIPEDRSKHMSTDKGNIIPNFSMSAKDQGDKSQILSNAYINGVQVDLKVIESEAQTLLALLHHEKIMSFDTFLGFKKLTQLNPFDTLNALKGIYRSYDYGYLRSNTSNLLAYIKKNDFEFFKIMEDEFIKKVREKLQSKGN